MNFLKKSPDSLVIISFILLFTMGLTWIVPAGEYQRVDGSVIPGTYQTGDSAGQSIADLLMAPFKGFEGAVEIIAFVLLVGGAFFMLTHTGALDAALYRILRLAERRPSAKGWVIAGLMLIFSICGMTFGMSEETMVFVLVTIPLARSMGYDTIVGVAIPFVGAGMGFAGAAFNPFTVGIAQGLAEITLFSGVGYRMIIWVSFTLLGILFVTRYARGIDQGKILPFMGKASRADGPMQDVEFNGARKFTILLFFLSLVMLMIGAMELGWYIPEICALFITLGVLACIVNRVSLEESVGAFYEGAKTMLPAAMVIALSKSILVLASDGKIIDTMLFHTAELAGSMPKVISVQIMFFLQGAINFFIPSGSGQAALTMPVMAPLSDLIGISRQTAVLAYQLGDGLFNLIIPTSGVTMGILAIGGIPFDTWISWIWKLMVASILLSMFFLALPVSVFEWV